MIWKPFVSVWFGDKPSVAEEVDSIESVINVAHNVRRPYWQNVGNLPWRVWYFKMACPDRVVPSDAYFDAFADVASAIGRAEKFPLLCHCRMGGHRGPSAAVLVFWTLSGRTLSNFNFAMRAVELTRPGFAKKNDKAVYRNAMIDYCRRKSK